MTFEPPHRDWAQAPVLLADLPLPPSPPQPAFWAVTVDAEDAPGLLSKLLAALSELQLDIRSADVRTSGGAIKNSFVVAKREGVLAQEVIDRIKAALA